MAKIIPKHSWISSSHLTQPQGGFAKGTQAMTNLV
jgi:hypothetical protein